MFIVTQSKQEKIAAFAIQESVAIQLITGQTVKADMFFAR
jgi:hypothetical protein